MAQTNREYAEALFLLAAENGQIDEYMASLSVLSELIEQNPEYIEFLFTPAIPLAERLGAIDEAFSDSMPEHVVSFIKLLCENGRIRSLRECISEFERLTRETLNRTVANVFSPVPLSDEQKSALSIKLNKLTGKNVELVCEIEPSLIGGLKIEIEGTTYDGSIKHRLHEIKGVIN